VKLLSGVMVALVFFHKVMAGDATMFLSGGMLYRKAQVDF